MDENSRRHSAGPKALEVAKTNSPATIAPVTTMLALEYVGNIPDKSADGEYGLRGFKEAEEEDTPWIELMKACLLFGVDRHC